MSEKIVQLNEELVRGKIKELVRSSAEETLNELLEKEAESLTQTARCERSEARQGYRSGRYNRNLTTTSGDVTLHMPRRKGVSFETGIIERYRRRESSVEEALIEMDPAGVSVRRVEDFTEAPCGAAMPVRTTAAAAMAGTSPRPPATLRSICRGSRACPSKRPSSSGIAGEQRGGGPH